MRLLGDRKERRALREAVLSEVQRVSPIVEKAIRQVEGDARDLERDLAALPGAASQCPRCGARMTLGPVKVKRRWYTLWTCGHCSATYRPSDFPAEARSAGRRR